MRVPADLLRLDCPNHARAWSTYVSTGKAAEVMRVLHEDRERLYARVSEYTQKLCEMDKAMAAAKGNGEDDDA